VVALLVAIWRYTWGRFIGWCRKPPLPWGYRGQVILRTLAGAVGGFYLATACAGLSARGLLALDAVTRNDATLAGRMIGFLVMAIALMWAYGCASQRRAWLGVALPAAVLSALNWWLSS